MTFNELEVAFNSRYLFRPQGLQKLCVESLEIRRHKICLKFAKQAQKSERFCKWFAYNNKPIPNVKTRHAEANKKIFKPVKTRTRRFQRSALPYLTNLLNEHY